MTSRQGHDPGRERDQTLDHVHQIATRVDGDQADRSPAGKKAPHTHEDVAASGGERVSKRRTGPSRSGDPNQPGQQVKDRVPAVHGDRHAKQIAAATDVACPQVRIDQQRADAGDRPSDADHESGNLRV